MNCRSKHLDIVILAIFSAVFFTAGRAFADSLTFSPASTSAGDGQSFSFEITLTTTHPFYGFSLYLESSVDNAFSVTGETAAATSPITDPNFVGSFPVYLTTAANSPDFGYSSTGVSNIAAGSYSIGTITISVASNVPHGTFTISTTTGVSGSECNDTQGDIYPLPQATETISVPEPQTLSATGLVALFLLLARRSRVQHANAT
jgi:hypothetical protein